jgi:hypothetical protein
MKRYKYYVMSNNMSGIYRFDDGNWIFTGEEYFYEHTAWKRVKYLNSLGY